jgi:hypothetical protein
MFGFKVPKLYFVSKASTIALNPQPSIPFDVVQARTLALSQVAPSYTAANFGTAWTLAVAYEESDAQSCGAANLIVVAPLPS